MPITVSIVEDDTPTREGLVQLINRTADFHCISDHASAEHAIAKIPACQPDVVLMDINLPGLSGVEAVRQLKSLLPKTQFIMLTVYKEADAIFNALMAGANGYLLKQTAPRELLSALREVCTGGAPVTSSIARKIIESFRQSRAPAGVAEGLTAREQEVLELLSQGYLYKEIGDKLQIGYRTVSTHLEHIYEKLHVHSRSQAVAKHHGHSENAGAEPAANWAGRARPPAARPPPASSP
jgi:DNA-binding NarL/FixJ family response regulator